MSRVRHIENQFYDKFIELSSEVAASSDVYAAICKDWPAQKSRIPEVKDYEVRCDAIMRETLTLLENSFITPFDREDINHLVRELDHIADGMDNVSARFDLYDIDRMRPEAVQMAELILRASRELSDLFDHFENFKKDPTVREKMHTVGTIEDEGDTVSRQGLANIFREHNDAVEVLKWKSLLDTMESTVDSCKGVANVVRSVLMKNA
jgi:predicted phosphate transport protein (TIGR00153 family)